MTQLGESVTSSELEALSSLVGGLAWLVLTRADIAIWVTTLQQRITKAQVVDLLEANRVL